MNEQQAHWSTVDYTISPTLAPEIRLRQRVFESCMCAVDAGRISREEAMSRIRQMNQAGEQVVRVALVDNPELSDPERRA